MTVSGRFTSVSDEQFLKADELIEEIEPGIVIDDKAVQPSNAESPINPIEPEMLIEVRLEQPLNASDPIPLTESGTT